MTINLAKDLFRTAARARTYLDSAAQRSVGDFLRQRQTPDGGFHGRDHAQSDLYYTVFGAAALRSLGYVRPLLHLPRYLKTFGSGEQLDYVHLACFIQLRSGLPRSGRTMTAALARLTQLHANNPSVYNDFLLTLAYDAAGRSLDKTLNFALCPEDGTNILAAATCLGVRYGVDVKTEAVMALLDRSHPQGGFRATRTTPAPDLLSTATALYALKLLKAPIHDLRKTTLDFVEALWHDQGGFCGHLLDDTPDCEYTFYALLALGCLI